jgi:hypothetical protein
MFPSNLTIKIMRKKVPAMNSGSQKYRHEIVDDMVFIYLSNIDYTDPQTMRRCAFLPHKIPFDRLPEAC